MKKLRQFQLAAECFAHAIMYYYTNITVKLFGRLRSWNNSGKEINVAANDNRSNQFPAIWFGVPFIRNYLFETIGVIVSFK